MPESTGDRKEVFGRMNVGSTLARLVNTAEDRSQSAVASLCFAWISIKLYTISPLPYDWEIGVLSSNQLRLLDLAFAISLSAFYSYDNLRSPARRFPGVAVLLALGGLAAIYVNWTYEPHSYRPGEFSNIDITAAVIGTIVVVEFIRRVVGLPVALICAACLLYLLSEPILPASLKMSDGNHNAEYIATFLWFSEEGVFGMFLGVASTIVFLAIILGAALDRLEIGHRAFARIIRPGVDTTGSKRSLPWLEGRVWTWAFFFFSVSLIENFRPAYELDRLFIRAGLLAFVIAVLYGVQRYFGSRAEQNHADIPRIFSCVVAPLILYLLVATFAFWVGWSSLVYISCVLLPMVALRTVSASNARSWKEKQSVTGETVLYSINGALLVLFLGDLLFILFALTKNGADVWNSAESFIREPLFIVGATATISLGAAACWARIGQTSPDRIMAATIVGASCTTLMWALGLGGFSPGLASFQAVVIVLILHFLLPIVMRRPREHDVDVSPFRIFHRTIIPWFEQGARNAVFM